MSSAQMTTVFWPSGAYNFVALVLPDFDEPTIRFRAMDFDQQSYDGRLRFYLPGSFKENRPFAQLCAKHINAASAAQYRREEQSLIHRRHLAAPDRVKDLLAAMRANPLTSSEKAKELADGLGALIGRQQQEVIDDHVGVTGGLGQSEARHLGGGVDGAEGVGDVREGDELGSRRE